MNDAERLQSAKAAIKGMASIIHEQRRELERLHRERDYAVERRDDLLTKVGKLEALKHHTPECHITTCPELEGCEERDGGALGYYMSHDCTCGLDDVRRMVYMRMLRPPYYDTLEEEQAAHRKELEEHMKHFHAASS